MGGTADGSAVRPFSGRTAFIFASRKKVSGAGPRKRAASVPQERNEFYYETTAS